MTEDIVVLLKSAYAAGYARYGAEMAGWETESADPENPLGFEEWLKESLE